MFPRTVLRKILPPGYRFLTVSPTQSTKQCRKSLSIQAIKSTSTLNSNFTLLRRWYAEKGNTEDMVVSYDQVRTATSDKQVLIIDVREPDEIKEHGKIPNSINIPLGNVSSVLGTMSDKEFEKTFNRKKPTEETKIIFYCMIGKRSGMAQQNAFDLGFKNVKNYLGSWMDWANKGK